MFVQVIQGRATDIEGLRRQWQRWDDELRPTAEGYLGSTAGVTGDGTFIALVRFDSEEAARRNSDRPEQGAWWEATSRFLEDVKFQDCRLVDVTQQGGSDDAGFVQVIQGRVSDVEKARELDKATAEQLSAIRPDVIGGIVAWHPQGGDFTNAIYFTSEAEARAKEKETATSPEFQQFMSQWQAIAQDEPTYLDLSDPWYSSP